MVDAVIEGADRDGTCRLVVQDAHRLGKIEFQLVHAQDLVRGLGNEDIAMFEPVNELEAFGEKVSRAGQDPSPARRLQLLQHVQARSGIERSPAIIPPPLSYRQQAGFSRPVALPKPALRQPWRHRADRRRKGRLSPAASWRNERRRYLWPSGWPRRPLS